MNVPLITPPLGYTVLEEGEDVEKRLRESYESWEKGAHKSFESMRFALAAGSIRYGARITQLTNLTSFGGNVWWCALTVELAGKGGKVMIFFQPPIRVARGFLPAEVLIFKKGCVDSESLKAFVDALCEEFRKR